MCPLGFGHPVMIPNWHAFAYQNTFFLNVMPYSTFSEMNSSHLTFNLFCKAFSQLQLGKKTLELRDEVSVGDIHCGS